MKIHLWHQEDQVPITETTFSLDDSRARCSALFANDPTLCRAEIADDDDQWLEDRLPV